MNFTSLISNWRAKPGILVAGAVLLFLIWKLIAGFSPDPVKVLDTRVSFKFTAYADHEEYFVSYSLENSKKKKMKAFVDVRLGKTYLGGWIFRTVKTVKDSVILEPLENNTFVTKIEISKLRNGKERNLDASVKLKRAIRA